VTPTMLVLSLCYLAAAVLFILCLRGLSSPEGARRGLVLGEVGMLIAVVATLLHKDIVRYEWILAGLVVGSGIGVAISAWIPMTKMPERIALSHSFGGLATALVGVAEYLREADGLTYFKMGALGFETFLGFLTFTGSIMAYGKLQGFISGAPITWRGQNIVNIGLFAASLVGIGVLVVHRELQQVFFAIAGTGFALGVMAVLPIGGADMPVVISARSSSSPARSTVRRGCSCRC
jgi:NAD(P) transhydrogenase subunit beta